MDMLFEFLIPRRPLSVQAKHKNRQTWKQFVRAEAAKTWVGQAPFTGDLHLTLVYLFDTDPADIDNIIKPIQDAIGRVGLFGRFAYY
jgi:Holliday junction resolvase RusA-like endonuclease